MNRTSFRTWFLTGLAGTALFSAFVAPAFAVERSLLGIPINSNVKIVLRRFGNPTYVINVGGTGQGTGMGMGGPGQGGQGGPGMGGPGSPYGNNGGFNSKFGAPGSMPGSPYGMGAPSGYGGSGGQYGGGAPPMYGGAGAGAQYQGGAGRGYGSPMGSLPPMQPAGGPTPAFGQAQLPQNAGGPQAMAPDVSGEVELVYDMPNGATYIFLLSPTGYVLQITSLGYSDAITKTAKSIKFGSSYTELLSRYGYPEYQLETSGVRVVNYTNRSHVAFELIGNVVVGIVVAAIQ